jgi:hypothetical protein
MVKGAGGKMRARQQTRVTMRGMTLIAKRFALEGGAMSNVLYLCDYMAAGVRVAERIRVSTDLQTGDVQAAIGEQISGCVGMDPQEHDVISQAFESCMIYLDIFDELFLDIIHKRTDVKTVENLAGDGLDEVGNARVDFIKARDCVHRALARAVKHTAAGT